MALSKDKKQNIQKSINKFVKSFADKSGKIKNGIRIGFMSEDENIGKIERLPTGIIGFDILTGGGWVKGKINQLWGSEGTGKTTLMLKSIANAQEKEDDFLAVYFNNEKTLDREYAKFLGVNPDDLIIGELTTTEESGDFCNFLTNPENGVDLAAFDTLQALSPEGELLKKGKDKSLADDTIGLIPRIYSQFLRMYTSKSVGTMTLILGSQARMDIGGFIPILKETGGNAIKHYNILTVQMTKLSPISSGNWPYTVTKATIPPKSFTIQLKIKKAKLSNRYEGNTIKIYFYLGKLDHKFNVLAIAKDLNIHDGKNLTYKTKETIHAEGLGGAGGSSEQEVEKEIKARGFMEMYNKIPDEAVQWLEQRLMDTYTNKVMENLGEESDSTDDGTEDYFK